MTMTPTGTRLLAELRHQLLDPPTQLRPPKIDTDGARRPTLSEPSPNMDNQEPKSVVIYTDGGTQPDAVGNCSLCIKVPAAAAAGLLRRHDEQA